MKKIKILFTFAVVLVLFSGCKYDEDWLDPQQIRPTVYFASELSYERTVIPGEGLQFGIGPALGGVITNKTDWSVDLQILKGVEMPDNRKLLPDNYYNSSELGGNIRVTIPKGEYMNFFYVKLDSTQFINDANTMAGSNPLYALPVKIVGTSAEVINEDRDQVLVAVKYQASFDGWYLHETTIEREHGGQMISGRTTTEKSYAEATAVTWRLATIGPFSVRATAPTGGNFNQGLQFNMTVNGNSVSYGAPVSGQPTVEAISGKTNSYSWETRDFELNFKYMKPENNDTIYHVSTKWEFRNRLIDGVNQPRHVLVY